MSCRGSSGCSPSRCPAAALMRLADTAQRPSAQAPERRFGRTTNAMDGGEAKPYGTWCMEAMENVYRFPKNIDKAEFMAFFEPEFREVYEARLKEER